MKKTIKKIEKNQYIKLIIVVAVVFGSIITIVKFTVSIGNYIYNNSFIEHNISNKLEHLSAGQSINYFKDQFGSEKIQRKVSEEYIEYVFYYRGAYIQTLVKAQDQTVIYWAITYCDGPIVLRRKVFSMAGFYTGKKDIFGNDIHGYSFNDKIVLNQSSFSEAFQNIRGDFKYFFSGATVNSYVYESVYLGNPSAYQTIIIGINDICAPRITLGVNTSNDSIQEDIDRFRENFIINTYGETAPFYGEKVLELFYRDDVQEDYMTFGVDRIKVRHFND